ncbi:hypothetical protein CMV_010718 [Castanea mollissima]|uniref:Uncharacterized protein n=1 Tax=Castanea mollissima TaxID=60419 RepID=A0A8J4R6I6_9ROSI|nr:hypothetical protein CMV_010718 [Castanea mollissima]
MYHVSWVRRSLDHGSHESGGLAAAHNRGDGGGVLSKLRTRSDCGRLSVVVRCDGGTDNGGWLLVLDLGSGSCSSIAVTAVVCHSQQRVQKEQLSNPEVPSNNHP